MCSALLSRSGTSRYAFALPDRHVTVCGITSCFCFLVRHVSAQSAFYCRSLKRLADDRPHVTGSVVVLFSVLVHDVVFGAARAGRIYLDDVTFCLRHVLVNPIACEPVIEIDRVDAFGQFDVVVGAVVSPHMADVVMIVRFGQDITSRLVLYITSRSSRSCDVLIGAVAGRTVHYCTLGKGQCTVNRPRKPLRHRRFRFYCTLCTLCTLIFSTYARGTRDCFIVLR